MKVDIASRSIGDLQASPKADLSELQAEVFEQLHRYGLFKQLRWLRANVDLEAPDVQRMTTKALRERFAAPAQVFDPKDPQTAVNDTRLLRTFIWQTWLRIKAKSPDHPPVRGNLRSFWYRYLEKFYRSHDLVETDLAPAMAIEDYLGELRLLGDTYGVLTILAEGGSGREARIVDLMGKCLDDFVWNRIFRFQDEFEFQEPIDNHRKLGRNTASTLFLTEKEGLWWLCRDIAKATGISVMASNGEPSFLTLEYFAEKFRSKGISRMSIGAFCDFDPWGWNIAANVHDKMTFFGFDVTTYYLTTADLFKNVEHSKRDYTEVLQSKARTTHQKALQTLVKRWFERTGGYEGKPWALHIDIVDDKRKQKLTNDFVAYIEKVNAAAKAKKPKPKSPWVRVEKDKDTKKW